MFYEIVFLNIANERKIVQVILTDFLILSFTYVVRSSEKIEILLFRFFSHSDILLNIVYLLDLSSIVKISSTSTQFYNLIIFNDSLWKQMLLAHGLYTGIHLSNLFKII